MSDGKRTCASCEKTGWPTFALQADGSARAACPHCNALYPRDGAEPAAPVVAAVPPPARQPAPPRAARHVEPIDVLALAREQLIAIDAEIARLEPLIAKRHELARMIAAGERKRKRAPRLTLVRSTSAG